MSGRILCNFVIVMLASGISAQAQQPAVPTESSKQELEEFANFAESPDGKAYYQAALAAIRAGLAVGQSTSSLQQTGD